jgi:hypothetical protein
MSKVVRKADSFDELGVDVEIWREQPACVPEILADRSPYLGNFQGMGKTCSIEIVLA